MKNRIEGYQEHKEGEPSDILVYDIESFYNCSLEKVGDQVVQNYLSRINNGEKKESVVRKRLKLSENQAIDKALKMRIDEAIIEYRSRLEDTKRRFNEQAKHCTAVARDRGYISDVKPLKIVITDDLLNEGIPGGRGKQYINAYDYENDVTIVTVDQPNKLLAHELGHALSTDIVKSRNGMQRIEKRNDGSTTLKGTKWFNEGLTVIWEDLSVNDKSEIPSRKDSGDLYKWYSQATKLVLSKTQVKIEDAFKAYFGNEEKISEINTKIKETFNCTLDDLDCLSYKLDINWTKKVINGESVEVPIRKTTHNSVIVNLEKLSRIFPNVKLVKVDNK